MSTKDERTGQEQAEHRMGQESALPQYEAPRVTPMSEKDVLKSFQVTSAATSWWGM